jgi:hypothetical protein
MESDGLGPVKLVSEVMNNELIVEYSGPNLRPSGIAESKGFRGDELPIPIGRRRQLFTGEVPVGEKPYEVFEAEIYYEKASRIAKVLAAIRRRQPNNRVIYRQSLEMNKTLAPTSRY